VALGRRAVSSGFQVLYADPPWQYANRGTLANGFRGGASQHYPLMKIEQLCGLPVGEVAGQDAVLFLWVPSPKLLEYGPPVLAAWGFEYKTIAFCWVKVTRGSGCGLCGGGKPAIGCGAYTRPSVELCLLATRGKTLKPARHDVLQVIHAPRGKHSEKPEAVARRIERLYSGVRKIELFARRERPGWTCVGHELTGHEIVEDLEALIRGERLEAA
jgi:site-specific DNA-methyltransferase (adenine-specific)